MSDSLSISSPTDLLHAVPFLLGFHPSESVVVLSIREATGRIGLTIRLDYPDPSTDAQVIVDRLFDHLIDDGAAGALMVIYREEGSQDEPLVRAMRELLDEHGLVLHDALLVREDRWWSLIHPENPAGEPIPDFDSSAIAAAHVFHGASLPLASESALRESLEGAVGELAERIASACSERRAVVARETVIEGDGMRMRTMRKRHIQSGADAVDRVFAAWVTSQVISEIEVADIAAMLIGMNDVHVRDYAMGIHQDEELALALALWRTLLPLAPTGSIAPAATVLAAVAFESGDGALAQRAIDKAFDDRPGYPMASLLRQAMEAGWAPASMTAMRKELRDAVVATVRAA